MDKAKASLYYWNGQDMYIGKFPANTEHRHHVIQIVIGVYAPFRLQIDGSRYHFRGVIIAPNVPHQVDDHDEWQLMLHIEPDSLVGRQLRITYLENHRFKEIGFNSVKPLLSDIKSFVDRIHQCECAKRLFDDIVFTLLFKQFPAPIDTHLFRNGT